MRFRHVLAAPLVAMLVATGCSGAANTGETNTDQLAAADTGTRDRGELATGGELRLAVDEFGSLNPMGATNTAELAELEQVFLPQFFRYDAAGVATPNPNFLASAEETSANPTRVTLKLNPNAMWADGQKISAQDVIATWRACNGKAAGFQCAEDLEFKQITNATAGASDSEVRLEFTGAYPQWRSIFDRVSVLRAESVADAAVFNEGWTTIKPEWTAGAFTVPSHDPAVKAIVAMPNEKFWGNETPLLARLTILEIPRENQVKAFTDAEIDAVDLAGSQEFFDAARAVPEHAIRRAGSSLTRQLVFNTTSTGAVAEPEVRRAIAVALDRSGVGTAAMPGINFTAAPLGNRIFVPGQQGYADNADTLGLTRDQSEAKKLLNDAGWRDEDGMRMKDGRPLEVKLVQIQGLATSENEARAIAEQLAEVGIRATITDTSLENFDNGSVLSGGDFDMIVIGVDGGREPLETLDLRYGSGADQNYARLESPEIDDLIDSIGREADAQQRLDLANQLDTKLWEQMPTVPLYQQPQTVATSVRLANYGAPGLASVVWENIGYVKP
ncbi:ABC transporter family substrate-binding protein [Ammonicoccus fulvus]|uniref:ABC transporter family substrate-binding protein n=1 Tax=Ammonicoccus fulvus TaxID=3138240 RepID=A0ABZ3FRL0_9ACTN